VLLLFILQRFVGDLFWGVLSYVVFYCDLVVIGLGVVLELVVVMVVVICDVFIFLVRILLLEVVAGVMVEFLFVVIFVVYV
ncbi:hypothetical protein, partial [Rhizobium brockwellii]|uniref:hypothetical protein n=1 Tax=Rhizobium brockwellii TaxID=3019932 RepID=UPI003F978F2C